ncbi:mucin-2 [Chiloscyllium plagiosum]|uniref:mucin-2 n=1 Tax=Chiloscyllium plagiosum TaxID=36176 RepID=UPI001CB88500|nr:mucin-2 [Chiloscyllium plagiosum]
MPFLGHNPNHNFRVCSTWGNYHFKTFDGDFYYFPGTCNYVFASQCLSSYEEFNIQMRRSIVNGFPRITHIVLKVDGAVIEVQNSIISADDNLVTLPYTHSGIVIEKVSNYTRITAKIGLTLIWNGGDALTLELGQQFVNTTCGLCGDFNGIRDNEFFSNGYHLTPIQYGNLQKLNDPKEQCNDVPSSEQNKNCSTFESMCERALTDPGFSNCYDILDLAPFIKSCMLDVCLCKDLENPSSCMCNTLSEFSRQCAHVGGKPSNWRRKEMCEKTCQFNMTYEECGIPCADTCSNPDRSRMCEDHCIDGCFCAPNTVLDDISNTGCIPKEQCPCTYNGLSYAPGESYSTKCSKCNCNGGQWSCTDLSCPGICSVEGGSHINTFDEKQYTFHGNCHYVLAKDCENTFFTVLGELQQCGITESETCLKSVSVTEHRSQTVSQIITINPNGRVSVNGIFSELPLTFANVTVFMPSTFHVIIHTSFGLQLQVQLVPIMQLYIRLDSVFKNRVCGLCGNFNNVLNDEFKIVSGLVEGTSAAFANTWKTKASCPDRRDIHENPCSLSVVNEKYAKHWCGLLLDDNSTFAQCHSHVNPNQYFEQCKYDSCNCEKSEDCMCAALSSYVQACATKGIIISNWRMNVCFKYLTCPKTLIYSYSMTSCHRTCKSLGAPDKTCEIDFEPVDGCGCANGTYMEETGKCVPPSRCPCYYRGLTVPAGEVIHEEDAMCTCNQGKLECIGKELKLQACAAPMVYFDCNNASADGVGTECQKSCQTLDMECYATGCVSGCVCPDGLVSDGSGGCIPINQCPCTHNGIQYHSGDIVQVDCNSCECKNRLWTCTNQQCHGTCMIYGDGNYVTFDGKRYNFNGDCEYVVAQDYCGNNTLNGTFRVITENIPCGTTGTTCSKSIKIFLGNLEIKLSGGKYEVVKFGSGKHIPYEVRYLGIYLVIEAKNGLVLIWDKKTSLTIKLSHSFQSSICGLCGNYDGNVHNDFTTRNRLVVVNMEEFGNSWKVSPVCPNAKKNEDPCSVNLHRDAWAQKQCSILKDKPFLACNSQINPTPYYEACVRDACACDTGGDCECLCTAIAAYSLACSMVGVCISWRNPAFCPLFCDYYNPDDECEWHYAPCGIPCLKTCRNPGGACSKIIPKLEGCYPDCPDDKPFLDEDKMQCVKLDNCPCYVNGNHYEPGHIVPSTQNCESCKCINSKVQCTYDKSECVCVYDGKTFHEGDIIYHTTDGIGGCIKATCSVNGTISREVYPCTPKTSTTPSTTLAFETTPAPTASSTRSFTTAENTPEKSETTQTTILTATTITPTRSNTSKTAHVSVTTIAETTLTSKTVASTTLLRTTMAKTTETASEQSQSTLSTASTTSVTTTTTTLLPSSMSSTTVIPTTPQPSTSPSEKTVTPSKTSPLTSSISSTVTPSTATPSTSFISSTTVTPMTTIPSTTTSERTFTSSTQTPSASSIVLTTVTPTASTPSAISSVKTVTPRITTLSMSPISSTTTTSTTTTPLISSISSTTVTSTTTSLTSSSEKTVISSTPSTSSIFSTTVTPTTTTPSTTSSEKSATTTTSSTTSSNKTITPTTTNPSTASSEKTIKPSTTTPSTSFISSTTVTPTTTTPSTSSSEQTISHTKQTPSTFSITSTTVTPTTTISSTTSSKETIVPTATTPSTTSSEKTITPSTYKPLTSSISSTTVTLTTTTPSTSPSEKTVTPSTTMPLISSISSTIFIPPTTAPTITSSEKTVMSSTTTPSTSSISSTTITPTTTSSTFSSEKSVIPTSIPLSSSSKATSFTTTTTTSSTSSISSVTVTPTKATSSTSSSEKSVIPSTTTPSTSSSKTTSVTRTTLPSTSSSEETTIPTTTLSTSSSENTFTTTTPLTLPLKTSSDTTKTTKPSTFSVSSATVIPTTPTTLSSSSAVTSTAIPTTTISSSSSASTKLSPPVTAPLKYSKTTTRATTTSLSTKTTISTSETSQPTSTTSSVSKTKVTPTTSTTSSPSTVPLTTTATLTTSSATTIISPTTIAANTKVTSEQSETTFITTSPTTVCSCQINGQMLSPGQAVVTSVGKSDLCNFTLCTKSCEIVKYTGKCHTTTAPTTTPSETATTVTVTPTTTETTRCSCHANGQTLSPGQAVVTSVGKSGLCNFTICTKSCEIMTYTGKCQTTTAPTTTPSETTTTVTVTPTSTETTRCSCHANGQTLSPGQAVVTSVGKSDLCNFTLCTKSCEIVKYTGKCHTTTAPTTPLSETATTVTVTPTTTETTRCSCHANGQTLSPERQKVT